MLANVLLQLKKEAVCLNQKVYCCKPSAVIYKKVCRMSGRLFYIRFTAVSNEKSKNICYNEKE